MEAVGRLVSREDWQKGAQLQAAGKADIISMDFGTNETE